MALKYEIYTQMFQPKNMARERGWVSCWGVREPKPKWNAPKIRSNACDKSVFIIIREMLCSWQNHGPMWRYNQRAKLINAMAVRHYFNNAMARIHSLTSIWFHPNKKETFGKSHFSYFHTLSLANGNSTIGLGKCRYPFDIEITKWLLFQ